MLIRVIRADPRLARFHLPQRGRFPITRLFRPFATTKQKGIGLGLFTCREIVEAHGGRLEVESKPGAGTRFRVVLPSRLFASGERFKSRSSEGAVGG